MKMEHTHHHGHNNMHRSDESHIDHHHHHGSDKSDKGDGHLTHNHHDHHRMMMEDFKRRFIVSVVLTVPVLLLSPFIQGFLGYKVAFPGQNWVVFILSAFIYFYGGWPFLKGTKKELSEKSPGMMTLIALAISVAFFYSAYSGLSGSEKTFYWELATLIDIMLIGHYIEMKSTLGAYRALEALASLMPSSAHLVKDGGVVEISVSELKKGDIVLVKPGEKIPADGVVIEGESAVDESMLTGESVPVTKSKNMTVIGGSVNLEGSLKVKVEKTGKDAYISQVMELVKKAQESRFKTQDLANRAAFWLTIIALSAGGLTFITWAALGKSIAFALERAVTVMVITCPHALGLAVPLVVAVSTAMAAKRGIIIRNKQAFERMKDVSAVVFDKTGTLTKGKFKVTEVFVFDDSNEEDIIRFASSLEVHSKHPIAEAIVSFAKEKGIQPLNVKQVKVIPGRGVVGQVEGKEIFLVNHHYAFEKFGKFENKKLSELILKGRTMVFVVIEGKISGVIGLADEIREESKQAVGKLKDMGIKVYMLTGDGENVARWVAEQLGIDGYFAQVLPHQKAEKIEELKNKGFKVAMVGDGINDAPALMTADVGLAIGAGTDVAIESADIILVKNNPLAVIKSIEISRLTYKKMIQNLAWATGYNAVAIPLAAGALYKFGLILSPAVGAILMSLSTVIVALNAKLMERAENIK